MVQFLLRLWPNTLQKYSFCVILLVETLKYSWYLFKHTWKSLSSLSSFSKISQDSNDKFLWKRGPGKIKAWIKKLVCLELKQLFKKAVKRSNKLLLCPPPKKGGWDMNKLVIMVHSKNNIPPIDPFFSTYPIQGVGKRLEPVPGGAGSDGGFKPRSLLL